MYVLTFLVSCCAFACHYIAAIMCSYNAAYGKPTCANNAINNDLVRSQWDWKGFYVSDCTALELMQNLKWDDCPHPWPSEGGNCTPQNFQGGHNYTHTVGDTIRAAMVEGGIDYNCGALYRTNLANVVKAGESGMNVSDLKQSVKRVYRTMFRLGMLDPPEDQYYINSISEKNVDSLEHRQLALQAARESIVLLKNEHHSLPLSKSIKRVAFVGPHANSTQSLLSNYHGSNILVNDWSPLTSARRQYPSVEFTFAQGARICDFPYGKNPGFPNMPCTKAGINATMIEDALDVVKSAQAVVLYLGSDQTTEAENFDRSSLLLAGNGSQAALLKAIVDEVNGSIPIVVVLIHGGPIAWQHDNVDSILDAFYPGELGGPAIVDVLFGDYAPSGKLPYTNYFENFTVRDIRNTNLSDNGGVTHQYFNSPVIFPFGHGLSYSTFAYGNIKVIMSFSDDKWNHENSPDIAFMSDDIHSIYQVNVTNTGNVSSDLVVLGFITSPSILDMEENATSQVRIPKQRLFDFERLKNVQPNETRQLKLSLEFKDISFVEEATGVRKVTQSEWILHIGDAKETTVHVKNVGVIERNDWLQSLL